jgi:Putative peptidoglycan binding domain/CHAP domain
MPAMLHVTSPAMTGRDVVLIQEKLTALGYAPGAIDGVYGPTTAAAVRAYQRDEGLEVDGVVGPQTRKALRGTRKPRKPETIKRRPSSLGQKALVEAAKHIGKKERPMNSNRTQFGRWFGIDGVAWCNTFVSFCFAKGANYTICQGFRGAGVYAKGCTYVPTTEAWLRATGMWRGRTSPLPGDIAIFNWDGGVPDHIGIVEEYLGGGKFHAIEGNTSFGNDSNGGQVMRRLRYLTQVNGFGRVARRP